MLKRPNHSESEADVDGGNSELVSSLETQLVINELDVPSVESELEDEELGNEENADGEQSDEEDDNEEEVVWLDRDTKAFLISLGVHVALLVALAAFPIFEAVKDSPMLMLSAVPRMEEP